MKFECMNLNEMPTYKKLYYIILAQTHGKIQGNLNIKNDFLIM